MDDIHGLAFEQTVTCADPVRNHARLFHDARHREIDGQATGADLPDAATAEKVAAYRTPCLQPVAPPPRLALANKNAQIGHAVAWINICVEIADVSEDTVFGNDRPECGCGERLPVGAAWLERMDLESLLASTTSGSFDVALAEVVP